MVLAGKLQKNHQKKQKRHKSMALKITHQRIENLNYKYKSSGTLKISDLNPNDKSGTKVFIAIPYRTRGYEFDQINEYDEREVVVIDDEKRTRDPNRENAFIF